MSELLTIEVVYATPDHQVLIVLELPAPTTVSSAVKASGLLVQFPELAGKNLDVGIFGRVTTLEQALKSGDRVEIYRPLVHNPKDARRLRAAK